MKAAASAAGTIRAVTGSGVRRISLANPPLNVLTTEMLNELADAVNTVDADTHAKVLLLTGEGPRAFCAGVDVVDHTPDRVHEMIHAFARAVAAILDAKVPVVAALNGAALGGGFELALACDIVLARDGVSVGQPEIRLGVFPPVAAVLLPRLVGRQAALDLILTGRMIQAEEARALGLVAATFPADSFEERVDGYVHHLAGQSAPVLRLAKRAVNAGAERTLAQALREADRIYLEELMALHDSHEGLAAFMEKRLPAWRDA
ncbi:MAG: enoyl-CoA hydratase/isomerase family protein [Gemmatimonadetes bacterium]|nr:enoyl-CoA hydratase/isomerase family protein [Gemmatimonadota bacterium]